MTDFSAICILSKRNPDALCRCSDRFRSQDGTNALTITEFNYQDIRILSKRRTHADFTDRTIVVRYIV